MKKISSILLIVLLAINSGIFAQIPIPSNIRSENHTVTVTVPEVALLDIYSGTAARNFSLSFVAPTVAGNSIDDAQDNSDLWLNYSSIQALGEVQRRITVQLDQNPSGGTTFSLGLGTVVGGTGTCGTRAVAVRSLSTTVRDAITGIGSCYTGIGVSHGFQLTYSTSFSDPDYAQLRAGNRALLVTYVMTDVL